MKISKDVTLPVDAITQTFGFIGRKGSGKTYASSKLAEAFLSMKVQVIVLDPVGNWYGLRLNKTGKKKSRFDLPIIGGEHGDIPLDHNSGALIADFILDTGSSAVIDVSHFRKGQRKEFVAKFAEELFHKQKKRRIPLHLFIEEAQVFIPQRAGKGEERMLGAMEDIVRLGRNYGIGVSLNSQRPQSVNKEVLNQVEPLVVFQTVGAHERKAIQEWVSHQDVDVNNQLKSLAELNNGECYFWSPAWMRTFIKTKFFEKETFDASSTPKLGDKTYEPVELKPVDLEKLNSSMIDMVKQAEENDPTKLKRRVSELERKLNQASKGISPSEASKMIKEAIAEDREVRKEVVGSDSSLNVIKTIRDICNENLKGKKKRLDTVPHREVSNTDKINVSDGLTKPHQRILNALAWWESTGLPSPYSRIQTAFVSGYKPNSGGFNNPLGWLNTNGYVNYPRSGYVALTDKGRDVAETISAPTSNTELQRMIKSKITNPQTRILEQVIDAYPNEISREELAEKAGYAPSSGGFNNPLGSLRTLGLIDYPSSGYVVALPVLFID